MSYQYDVVVVELFALLRMNRLLNQVRFSFSETKKTALYDWHVANKGKIVDFAGYKLPVQFAEGVLKEHLHTRSKCSLFDVSHMGQVNIKGPDSLKFIERATVGDLKNKSVDNIYESYLSLILNEKAGIIDDTIINYDQGKKEINMVVNGANKHKVMEHFKEIKKDRGYNVDITLDDSRSLISVQGPLSAQVLQSVFKGLKTANIPFMSQFTYKDPNYSKGLTISRTSYAGTDGFEVSIDNSEAVKLVEELVKNPDVKPAGLGARDSLRIEAGLCLHGHDMTEEITPLEATLMWTVRKNKNNRQHFIGQEALEKQVLDNKQKKVAIKKRAGFSLTEPGIVREGAKVFNSNKEEIGYVSSGTHSPVLKKGVGMVFVNQSYTKADTDILVSTRDKFFKGKITKMPFVEPGYNRLWDKI